jgi:hypothetical protein
MFLEGLDAKGLAASLGTSDVDTSRPGADREADHGNFTVVRLLVDRSRFDVDEVAKGGLGDDASFRPDSIRTFPEIK